MTWSLTNPSKIFDDDKHVCRCIFVFKHRLNENLASYVSAGVDLLFDVILHLSRACAENILENLENDTKIYQILLALSIKSLVSIYEVCS